jgi:TRAP-type uncharacterized transport system substrate-binding protein
MASKPMRDPAERLLAGLTWKAILALSLLSLALAAWFLAWLHPLPPRTLTLASGPEGSSYAVFAKRYKRLLEQEGIELKVIVTAGGGENMELLKKVGSGVDLGFVDGDVDRDNDDDESGPQSLGTLCYEPMWFFARQALADQGLAALKGKRVSVGPPGSESRVLMEGLIKRKALEAGSFQMLSLTPEDSAAALLSGTVDAVVLVNSYASPVVRKLAKSDGIGVMDFPRATAFAALFPSLTKRMLPAGVIDLQKDRPSKDVNLLAAKTSLVARKGLHPALQYLLLETIARVHNRSGIFQKANEFPAPDALDIPLSPQAAHYYKSGQPFLQRYLPFWLAVLAEEMLVLLIPLLGLSYPLVKGLLFIYEWGMQRRIFSIYGELYWLESQMDQYGNQPVPQDLLLRFQTLEERGRRVRVAAKYMPMLFHLREILVSVRSRVDARAKKTPA